MNFKELVERQVFGSGVCYDERSAVYLEPPFSPESEVRFGQTSLRNGGLLDEKIFYFFATNAQLIDELWRYCGEEEPPVDAVIPELVDHLLYAFA